MIVRRVLAIVSALRVQRLIRLIRLPWMVRPGLRILTSIGTCIQSCKVLTGLLEGKHKMESKQE